MFSPPMPLFQRGALVDIFLTLSGFSRPHVPVTLTLSLLGGLVWRGLISLDSIRADGARGVPLFLNSEAGSEKY